MGWKRPAVAVLAVLTLVTLLLLPGRLGKGIANNSNRTTPTTKPATTLTNSTFGVQASWVTAENAKPGTNAWQLPLTQTGSTIAGYADHTSASDGQTVTLYVSTSAPSYHVIAYRMGYYGGKGGRQVWASSELPGVSQSTCPVTSTTFMVSCSWQPSVTVNVDATWPQGDYLFVLTADPGQSSYIPLTVIDPSSHGTYLVVNSLLTWQAWNTYGNYSAFGGPSGNTNRSRVVSFDRPYATSQGASDFLYIEEPFVYYAEEHGLDLTYTTDIVLSEQPQTLLQHKVVVSLGHNEFWTASERQAVLNGLGAGVNLMFLGATAGLRPARLMPSPLGTDREIAEYKDASEDPATSTNPAMSTPAFWSDPPLDDPAGDIIGDSYGGYGINDPMVITESSNWVFAGTGVSNGSQLPGVVAGDYDNYVSSSGPADIEILAHSPVQTSYGTTGAADMTYYTVASSGSGVFATGSIGWIPAMAPCPATPGSPPTCTATVLQLVTGNVLDVFGQGPAGQSHPSVPNSSQYYGPGKPPPADPAG